MKTPIAAAQLGYAGLAPFAVAAAATHLAPEAHAPLARLSLLLYGGVILSFMGGCRWGFAAAGLGPGPTFLVLAASVTPALWAFFILIAALAQPAMVSFGAAAAALAVGFIALWGWDRAAAAEGAAPAWWMRLRTPLTIGASLSLALGAASVA
ncbi:MAG: DUF3429 domain-containing protein [Pseudomonadota bacterium]